MGSGKAPLVDRPRDDSRYQLHKPVGDALVSGLATKPLDVIYQEVFFLGCGEVERGRKAAILVLPESKSASRIIDRRSHRAVLTCANSAISPVLSNDTSKDGAFGIAGYRVRSPRMTSGALG